MTNPTDEQPDQELDITPEGEKRWVVEARAVVSQEWWATMLACVASSYGMEATIRPVGGDEGEGEGK